MLFYQRLPHLAMTSSEFELLQAGQEGAQFHGNPGSLLVFWGPYARPSFLGSQEPQGIDLQVAPLSTTLQSL